MSLVISGRGRKLWTITGLTFWAVAAALAVQGELRAGGDHPDAARPWLIAAALVGLAGVSLIEWFVTEYKPVATSFQPVRLSRRRRIGARLLLALGAASSLAATGLLVARFPEAAATSLWVNGLIAIMLGGWLLSYDHVRLTVPRPGTVIVALQFAVLLAIVALAAGLRLPALTEIPPNIHGDEASIGLEARRILDGQMPAVFAVGWYDVPSFSFLLHAATMRVFGDNLFGLRMASVLEGLLSVVLLFLLARRLWGPRPALIAAALMCIAAWHIHFSRTGFHYMQALVAALLTLYFVVRATQDRRIFDWLVAGVGVGLSLEVYYAARLVPLIVMVYLGYRAATEPRFIRIHRAGLAAVALGAFVFLAPIAAVFARNPGDFNARTSGVLITNPENLSHELAGYHVNSLPEVIGIQARRTLEAFNIGGETSLQYGHTAPLLDPWTGGLLAMSAAAVFLRFGSSRGVLLASWVWLALGVGSVLTIDAPFSPRILVALPAIVIAPALMLDRAWSGIASVTGRIGTYAFAVPLLGVFALALQANVHDYFDVQVIERQPANRYSLLARYAETIADHYQLYTIGSDDWSLTSEAPRLLVRAPDAVNVGSAPLPLPLSTIPSNRGVAFLVENRARDYAKRMADIQRLYSGHEQIITDTRDGTPVFTSYTIENADLLAANPAAVRQ